MKVNKNIKKILWYSQNEIYPFFNDSLYFIPFIYTYTLVSSNIYIIKPQTMRLKNVIISFSQKQSNKRSANEWTNEGKKMKCEQFTKNSISLKSKASLKVVKKNWETE